MQTFGNCGRIDKISTAYFTRNVFVQRVQFYSSFHNIWLGLELLCYTALFFVGASIHDKNLNSKMQTLLIIRLQHMNDEGKRKKKTFFSLIRLFFCRHCKQVITANSTTSVQQMSFTLGCHLLHLLPHIQLSQ